MSDESPIPTVQALARVFGHDPASVRIAVIPRSTAWRAGRAARYLAGGAVLAPVVAVLPPHAPWAVGAGAGAVVLALRRWRERFTLTRVEGLCPRCGRALALESRTPLRQPHPLPCDGCGSAVMVSVDAADLPTA